MIIITIKAASSDGWALTHMKMAQNVNKFLLHMAPRNFFVHLDSLHVGAKIQTHRSSRGFGFEIV